MHVPFLDQVTQILDPPSFTINICFWASVWSSSDYGSICVRISNWTGTTEIRGQSLSFLQHSENILNVNSCIEAWYNCSIRFQKVRGFCIIPSIICTIAITIATNEVSSLSICSGPRVVCSAPNQLNILCVPWACLWVPGVTVCSANCSSTRPQTHLRVVIPPGGQVRQDARSVGIRNINWCILVAPQSPSYQYSWTNQSLCKGSKKKMWQMSKT